MENRIQINGVWYVREDVSNSNEIEIFLILSLLINDILFKFHYLIYIKN